MPPDPLEYSCKRKCPNTNRDLQPPLISAAGLLDYFDYNIIGIKLSINFNLTLVFGLWCMRELLRPITHLYNIAALATYYLGCVVLYVLLSLKDDFSS